jgi:hypothetical protein
MANLHLVNFRALPNTTREHNAIKVTVLVNNCRFQGAWISLYLSTWSLQSRISHLSPLNLSAQHMTGSILSINLLQVPQIGANSVVVPETSQAPYLDLLIVLDSISRSCNPPKRGMKARTRPGSFNTSRPPHNNKKRVTAGKRKNVQHQGFPGGHPPEY